MRLYVSLLPAQLLLYLSIIGGVLLLVLLYRKLSFSDRCPACGDRHPDGLPRPRLLKTFLPFLIRRAYQCANCRNKYYSLSARTSYSQIKLEQPVYPEPHQHPQQH